MGPFALTLDKFYRATIGRLLLNMAERVIAFDKDYAEDYCRFYRVPNKKIRIIPNGIDYSYYNQSPNSDDLKDTLGNPENIILYIGRFIDYKKPDLLIASFRLVLKHFPKSCLLMIGKDYGLLPYCRKLAFSLGLKQKVVFIEDASEETKLKALKIADVVVIPSDYESFGLVALEAQAAGVPVVASKVGGLKYLIQDGLTGLFLTTRETKEIASKIMFLLDNSEIRTKMSFEARKNASKYSWDNVTNEIIKVYEEIINSAG
jgi:D-inositol-3-phosphate glycosyltransferase